MARKKVFRPYTPAKLRGKIYKTLEARVDAETAKEIAVGASGEWNARWGSYRVAYERLKAILVEAGVPVGMAGLYRSFLFLAMKRIPEGWSPEALVDYYSSKVGLPEDVLWNILEEFGLARRPSTPTPTAPAKA